MVQNLDHERHLTVGKDFSTVTGVAHVSEAALVKVNVDDASSAGFGICESLLLNLPCRNRRGRRLWASTKICLCGRDL